MARRVREIELHTQVSQEVMRRMREEGGVGRAWRHVRGTPRCRLEQPREEHVAHHSSVRLWCASVQEMLSAHILDHRGCAHADVHMCFNLPSCGCSSTMASRPRWARRYRSDVDRPCRGVGSHLCSPGALRYSGFMPRSGCGVPAYDGLGRNPEALPFL